MNLFQIIRYDEPDRMMSVKRIKNRLKELGFNEHVNSMELHDVDAFWGNRLLGQAEAIRAVFTVLDEYDCPNCGRVIKGGERFCPNCGTKIREWEEYK